MAHKRIKFTDGHDDKSNGFGYDEDIKGWHLLAEIADGEFTACGLAEPEYETKEEIKEKGGITCKNCLAVISYYKSIKL